MPIENIFSLQPTYNDSWPHSDHFREMVNRLVREDTLSYEVCQNTRRNECVGGKTTGLCFVLLHFRIDNAIGQIFCRIIKHERALVPVEKDVSEFVKECKPELIVSLVSQGQAN